MSEIRCIRVDPPAKPSRVEAATLGALAAVRRFGSTVTHAEIAREVEKALTAAEADTPEPTYRIELSREDFEALRTYARREQDCTHWQPPEATALWRAIDDATGEESAKVGPELPNDSQREGTFNPAQFIPVGGDDRRVNGEVPNRCPGNSVTPEELAEWIQNERAEANGVAPDWASVSTTFRATSVVVARRMLARFFPEHVTKPTEPVAVVERCGSSGSWPTGGCVRPKGHRPFVIFDPASGVGCSTLWRPEDGPEPIAKTDAEA